jgi:plastocyanin domain-containing protein
MNKRIFTLSLHLALATLTLAPLSACTGSDAAKAEPANNEVSMVITDKGFEPQNLTVKQGQPVKLTITRKTNSTCATEIVIDEYQLNVKLPLNTPVTVTFTPTKSGTLKYGCAMNKMIGGVIKVI